MTCFDPKNHLPSEQIRENAPLSEYTTFRIGGPCKAVLTVSSEEEAADLIRALRASNERFTVLGRGSNVLCKDEGYDGYVVCFRPAMKKIVVAGKTILAEAGALLSEVANEAYKASLTGLEFASGIPGTVGGGLYMNAGAYGSEMKDVVLFAHVLFPDGTVKTVSKDEMELSYRHSAFMGNGGIVLSALFGLRKGNKSSIKATSDELNAKRREKQPLDKCSAGSVFKRPEGYFAGKLIEDAGLKGYRVGGAFVSEKHAGFIVSEGKATCSDVLSVIDHVEKTVYETSGVKLSREIRILGE